MLDDRSRINPLYDVVAANEQPSTFVYTLYLVECALRSTIVLARRDFRIAPCGPARRQPRAALARPEIKFYEFTSLRAILLE